LNPPAIKPTVSSSGNNLNVQFHAPTTGRYKVTAKLHGQSISGDSVEILVKPPTVAQQHVVLPPDFTAGSKGFNVDLALLTDQSGRRFYFEAADVHCDVVGGPEDLNFESRSRMSKNSDGTLTLTLNPKLPGQYQAQFFVYQLPLFPQPLKFTIVEDEGTPQGEPTEEPPSNPLCGRRNMISVSHVRDVNSEPLTRYNVATLISRGTGPAEWEGRILMGRDGGVVMSFTPPVDGYYKVMITENGVPILRNPFEIYVGTPELTQQQAGGNQTITISRDGAQVALMRLTDQKNNPIKYTLDDIRVEITQEQGQPLTGAAEIRSDGSLLIHLNPSKVGNYVCQAYWKGRPILVRPLVFNVA
jgi:hypothetical protein